MGLRFALMLLVFGQIFIHSALAGAAEIAPAELNDLRTQRTEVLEKIKTLDESRNRMTALQAERSTAADSLRLAENNSRAARDNLEKKQKYDRENPGEITAKLREAEEQNKQAAIALKLAKEELAKIDRNITNANATASSRYVEFKRLQQSFDSRLKALVENQLQARVAELQVSKVVIASGTMSCGDDGVRLCKDKSRKEAEKHATEQGSIIDFSSFTEVENFQLSKEEISSEVHANLSNEKILSQKLVDESAAVTEISVKVDPVISSNLRRRIAESIRDDLLHQLGGRIDASEVIDPSIDAATAMAQRRKEDQERQKAGRLEAELERQADEAHRQQQGMTGDDQGGEGRFTLRAGTEPHTSATTFTGVYSNKKATANYADTVVGLAMALGDSYSLDIAAASGAGKHNLYSPLPNQSIKHGSLDLTFSSTISGGRDSGWKYFVGYKIDTTQMAAIG